MKLTNWGNFPSVDATIYHPDSAETFKKVCLEQVETIPRGLGRCYGDSALNSSVISTLRHSHFLSFDRSNGILHCESGVSFEEILDVIVPSGWFLPVTPGTKYVTVGGAIAADVHGKNHHKVGSFCSHIRSMELLTPDGNTIVCSSEKNPEIFHATCGGMGLTGIILSAEIQLIPIESRYIRQEIKHAKNLEEIFNIFEKSQSWTYTVAWIDCLATGTDLGRSVMIRGEHALKSEVAHLSKEPLKMPQKMKVSIPMYFPDFVLSAPVVKVFNFLRNITYSGAPEYVDYDSFFYPLDFILEWNKIYGKRGLLQYQCVFPLATSFDGITSLLKAISGAHEGSFLAVLKLFGKQDTMISFPMEGYTLALDFPVKPSVLKLFDTLDQIVMKYDGRLYLAKDARMSPTLFAHGNRNLSQFLEIKKAIDPSNKFQSLQSKRVFA